MYYDKNHKFLEVGDWVDTKIPNCFGQIQRFEEDFRGMPIREIFAEIKIYAMHPFLHNFPIAEIIRITAEQAMIRMLEQ